ncbi:unnamed protein product, partial [Didymodactylos carnosus]
VLWLWLQAMSIIKRDPRDILSCGGYYSCIVGSSMISNFLLANGSFDRVLIIIFPHKYQEIVTNKRVLLRIILTVLIISLLMTHFHFSLYYQPELKLSARSCEYYPYARLWIGRIWPIVHSILFAFIPSFIICTCSFIILWNRYHHKMKTVNSTAATRMKTLSLLLVIFSIYSTLTLLPITILQFFSQYFLDDNTNCRKIGMWKMLLYLCCTLMAINYSNKFYINLVTSTQFRQDFLKLVTFKRKNVKNPNNRLIEM